MRRIAGICGSCRQKQKAPGVLNRMAEKIIRPLLWAVHFGGFRIAHARNDAGRKAACFAPRLAGNRADIGTIAQDAVLMQASIFFGF